MMIRFTGTISLLFVLLAITFIPLSFAEPGDFISSFDGSDGAQFSNPYGVAVDSNDRIIVSDTSLDVVQIYDSNGDFISSFYGGESGGTQFSFPHGIAVDSDDRIIVSDPVLNIVQIFDSNGNFISDFYGIDGTQFVSPYGVMS